MKPGPTALVCTFRTEYSRAATVVRPTRACLLATEAAFYAMPTEPSTLLMLTTALPAAAGTINYEVVTRISPRVPRVYRNA